MSRPVPPCLAALLLALVACSSTDHSAAKAHVTGMVNSRGRLALTPDAILEVKLVDVSRADAPSITLSGQKISPVGPPPIPFSLPYDPAVIDPRLTYAVQARITEGGRLRYISTTRHAVLTRGAPAEIEVWVEPVR